MKFNFKKIASIMATTVMLGSTIAFSAAAYPAPFVSSGAADAAIVVGSAAAATDMAAATDLQSSLNAGVTATGATTVGGEGDKIKIERNSDKIHLGDGTSTVWGTSITKTDLKTLLADGVFNNKQNSEYKYNQKFDIGNLTFSHFSDSDYNNRVPTIGFKVDANTHVANYTLSFVTYPESTSTTGNLDDFENKNIDIMGKNYYILDFKNSSNGKLTLLDAASATSLNEGETKTITVGDKSYEVSINFITTGEIILTVNGVNTEKLSADGVTYGNTYKLADGTYVGIKTINVQPYAGGTKSVDFSLGKGKLEITGGAGSVKINDKSIDDLYGYFTFGDTSGKTTWQKMVIEWIASDEAFLTSGKELTMPGFSAIKFTAADATIPAKEITTIEYGSSDYWQIKTTLKNGAVTIPILYMSTSTGNISGLGQSATQKLATTNDTTLFYNATSGTPQNDGFIVSWNNTKDAESYYLKATVRLDSDAHINLTTITDKITGDILCEDVKVDETCTIGNIILKADDITYLAGKDRTVNFTMSNSGGSFDNLYTAGGLEIVLPFIDNSGAKCNRGAINITDIDSSHASWVLHMTEKDKEGTLGKVAFNVTLQSTGTTSFKATLASSASTDGTNTPVETATSSKVWESYVYSPLATKIVQDRTNSDQYSETVEYHSGETYANLYVAAPSVTSTSSVKITVVKDSEVTSVSGKNLIVVGGSCINTVAATLLGSTTPICGDAFATATGAGVGKYLIATYASTYNTQKVAMLVAGYEAADTTAAIAKVKEGAESTDVGSKVVYPLATA